MFDIGFWELLLIAIIGLVVLGPQRLPTAIQTVARWMGAMRRTFDTVKYELDQELKLEKLRQDLKEVEQRGLQNISPGLKSSVDQLKAASEAVQQPFREVDETVKRESQILGDSLRSPHSADTSPELSRQPTATQEDKHER